MKLDTTEIHFIKQSVERVSISAKDAPFVAELIVKIDKEFLRLQKLEEKKEETVK
jgi:hypothetical protein